MCSKQCHGCADVQVIFRGDRGTAHACGALVADPDSGDCPRFRPYGHPSGDEVLDELRTLASASPSDLRSHTEGDGSPIEQWWERFDALLFAASPPRTRG
jgi:hypothetical protein